MSTSARRQLPARVRQSFARLGRRVVVLWLALVLGLAAGLGFLFYFSSAFAVEQVQVTGAREDVAAGVLDRAAVPVGRPLARVSETRIRERVLQDPRIEALEVDRDWPSGVTLVVTEREPAVALRGQGATWLADADGVVYEQVDDPSNKLPLISLRADPGELDQQTVTGLVELWRLRPDPAELEGQLSAPRVDSRGEIEMRVGKVALVWGPPTDNELKWRVVRALIGQETIDPQGDLSMTIDVRIPGTPVVDGLPEATG